MGKEPVVDYLDAVARFVAEERDANVDPAVMPEPAGEQVVDYLSDSLRARHIQRLQEGACSVDQGLIFTDLLSDYRRVSDHCSNIAAAIIELQHNSYDTHQYLGALKKGNENFTQLYESYMTQFPLPQ